MIKIKRLLWRGCCAVFVLLSVILFTPWVIPRGTYSPLLFGIPFTLWMGIIMAIAFVLLTYIGSQVHPGVDLEKDHVEGDE